MIYAVGAWKYVGFVFVVLYGWEMITSQLRYKIGGRYSIDSGIFGPTEVRLLLATIITLEVIIPHSLFYTAIGACLILLISNIIECIKLLYLADQRDLEDKKTKQEQILSLQKENA